MTSSLATVWTAVVLAIVILSILVRFLIKKYGKKTGDTTETGGYDNVLDELRDHIVIALSESQELHEIEKDGGRDAVKAAIIDKIKSVIANADFLTQSEIFLLNTLDFSTFADIIERELIKLGILTDTVSEVPDTAALRVAQDETTLDHLTDSVPNVSITKGPDESWNESKAEEQSGDTVLTVGPEIHEEWDSKPAEDNVSAAEKLDQMYEEKKSSTDISEN